MNQLDDLIPEAPRGPSVPVILYGEVESIDPLVITVDGDEEPLEIEPSTTVDGIIAGDKVAMTLQNDELIVTGIIDGEVDYVQEFIEGIAVAQEASISASLDAAEAAAAATAAQLAADNAQTSANGRNRLYYQTAQPTGGTYVAGDTWFDTDDSNRIYRWSGSAWVATSLGGAALSDGAITAAKLAAASVDSTKLASAVNAAISNASSAASAAQTTANGKNAVYYASSAPMGGTYRDGDVWFDTANGNRMYRRSGASWVLVQFGTPALADDAVTADIIADSVNAEIASKVDAIYVASRGTDLVTNGTALLGTNQNFSQFTLDSADTPVGGGSFDTVAGSSTTRMNDEYIPVDPSRKYILRLMAKQKGVSATARGSAGLAPYDVDKLSIGTNHYMYQANTTTTIATTLAPGATKIVLTSAAGWNNAAGASTWLRSLIAWNYVDGKGKAWGVETYSRNSYKDIYNDGAISGNEITLRVPWAGPTIAAGTPVSNGSQGVGYMYSGLTDAVVPQAWTAYASATAIGGAHTNKQLSATTAFPPGTAFVKLAFTPNRQGGGAPDPGSKHSFASISFSDTTSAQVTADAALASANGKNRVYYQTVAPSGVPLIAGDTWFDTDDANRVYRYTGSSWAATDFGANALANNAVTSAKLVDDAVTAAKIATAAVTATKIATDAVGSSAILANAITSTKIATDAVTSAKLVDDAVTAAKIATAAVTATKIATDAVGSSAILANAITSTKIATDAVTSAAIASNAVGTAELASASVTTAKIANLAVGTAQIADAAIVNAKIGSAAVLSANIQDAAITTAKINDAAIVTAKIADASIVNAKVGAAAISTANIQDLAVSGAKIADATIVNAKIADGTIQNAKIGNLDAAKITTGSLDANRIAAGSIAASKLTAGTITAASGVIANAAIGTAQIADAAITTAKIGSAQITNANIADATISDAKIATLDAAKITTGSLNANRIAAASITGAKIAAGTVAASNMISGTITAASGIIADAAIGGANIIDASITSAKIADASIGNAQIANLDVAKLVGNSINGNFVVAGSFEARAAMGGRVVMDSSGIRAYDGANQLATNIDTSGNSTFRGQVESTGVEVFGKLKFHGSDSEVAAGARLNITGGVTPPGTSPNVYPEWLTVTLSGVPKTHITGVTRDPANGDWIVASADLTGTPTVTRHNATTGALVATVGTFPAIANGTYPDGGGLAYADGTYWAPRYIKTVESFKTYGVFQIVALTGSARTLTPKTEMGFAYFDDFATIGSTGNTGQIAIRLKDHARSTDIRRLVLYTTSTSTRTVDVAEPTGVGGFWYSGAVAHHTFDFGVARFGMIAPARLAKFHDPTAGAEDTPRGFDTGRSNIAQGFGYYGGSMWSSDSGKCYVYDGPNVDGVEFAASWYDSKTAGTGKHETPLGPSGYSQTGIKRARLRVHPPLLTTTTGDDGVDSVRLYARISGAMRLQGTLTIPGTSLLITGALASGVVHGGEANFPATSPGSIENSTGDIVLPGNGPAQLKMINIPRILAGETIDGLPAGLYMPGDGSLITTGRGYPFANVLGVLEILGSVLGTGDVHRYTTFEASPRIALRSRVGGTWSAWTQIGGSVARPRAQGVINTSKSMPSGTTTITGWTESYDIGSGFNPSTGAYVVPAGQGGLWSIGMGLSLGTASTRRAIGIDLGGAWLWREEGPATGYSEISFARDAELAAGATLLPKLYCAAAVSIRGDQDGGAYFQVRRIE